MFYFGNLAGEIGDNPAASVVISNDVQQTSGHPTQSAGTCNHPTPGTGAFSWALILAAIGKKRYKIA